MRKLANDIREYIRITMPFEYSNAYETDADAYADILHTLQDKPEVITDLLAEVAEGISDSIGTVDEYSEEWKSLWSEYEEILSLVNRIWGTYPRISI